METNKVSLKQHLEVKHVITYLQDLAKSFKEGKVVVEQADNHVVLELPEAATVKVEAKTKKDKAKFALELSWKIAPEGDSAETVTITSKVPEPKSEAPVTEAKDAGAKVDKKQDDKKAEKAAEKKPDEKAAKQKDEPAVAKTAAKESDKAKK